MSVKPLSRSRTRRSPGSRTGRSTSSCRRGRARRGPGSRPLGWSALRPALDASSEVGGAGGSGRVRCEEVPYDDVHDLRVAWTGRTSPTGSARLPRAGSRGRARRRPRCSPFSRAAPGRVRPARARRRRRPRSRRSSSIRERARRGLGTALTRAAIAGRRRRRPVDLRRRRGPRRDSTRGSASRPAWLAMEFTRLL